MKKEEERLGWYQKKTGIRHKEGSSVSLKISLVLVLNLSLALTLTLNDIMR